MLGLWVRFTNLWLWKHPKEFGRLLASAFVLLAFIGLYVWANIAAWQYGPKIAEADRQAQRAEVVRSSTADELKEAVEKAGKADSTAGAEAQKGVQDLRSRLEAH